MGDYRSPNTNPGARSESKILAAIGMSDSLPTIVGGSLNPQWVEWLMNYPLGWTDLTSPSHPEPNIPRVAQGVKNRVDRLKGLGNAILPKEWPMKSCEKSEKLI